MDRSNEGSNDRTSRRRGAWIGLVALAVAVFAVVGVARSAPAEAGVARITGVVCLDLDLSVDITADAAALIRVGEPLSNDHIGALVRLQTATGAVTDWQPMPDAAARQFQDGNGHHFDDTLLVVRIDAAVAVQVRLEALGTWSDGSTGGLVDLPWAPVPECGPTAPAGPPSPAGGLLDATVDAAVDLDLDLDGVIDADVDVDADLDLDLGLGLGDATDADADVDIDADLDLDLDLDPVTDLPALPVPAPVPLPTLPGVPPVPPVPPVPTIDLEADLDVGLDLDLGLVPVIVGPLTTLPVPTTPNDDPSLVGIAARVRCGTGIDADLDLVLAGRVAGTSHVVVTHPDTLLALDVQLGAGTTQVVPLLDVVLGHRVLQVLVDDVLVDVNLDLSCPIDLADLLVPTCSVLDGGVAVHLASELDAGLALLLGIRVLDPVTDVDALATLHAGATVDLWLDRSSDGSLLEVHVQLLGTDLAVGLLPCTQVTPTPTTPNLITPTTGPIPTDPIEPTDTTVPTGPTGPTSSTPGSADPASPSGSADPDSGLVRGVRAASASNPVSGPLPTTGANSMILVAAAAALVTSGLVITQLARRRRSALDR